MEDLNPKGNQKERERSCQTSPTASTWHLVNSSAPASLPSAELANGSKATDCNRSLSSQVMDYYQK